VNFSVKLTTGVMPTRATDGAAGFDLYVPNGDTWHVRGSRPALYGLGFSAEFPKDMVALVFIRSGVATKRGVALANSVAVIDSDYRGEWMLSLHRTVPIDPALPAETFHSGERVAQVVFLPVPYISAVRVENLTDTQRGSGGFGSTGV
jgi:dUTP pyrophosphatase